MTERQYPIPHFSVSDLETPWPAQPIRSVLVVGHGALAARQEPVYFHWLANGVDVHCADIDSSKLDGCLDGIHRYVLPEDERLLTKAIPEGVDLLCVNNIPELHLVTAIQWHNFARHIIIQKPQDLNYPLIKTVACADGLSHFRRKTKIHDHYRNKGVAPALWTALPSLITERGQFRRILLFLTEPKSVNDELQRAESLKCGMIQDLAVHMIDLLFSTLNASGEWRNSRDDERLHRRVGGTIEIKACHKRRELSSNLGDDVETFAAIDLSVTEVIEFPAGEKEAKTRERHFDVLIVVGKGVTVEQGIEGDVKLIVAEFERGEGYEAWVDFKTLTINGFQNLLPDGGTEINRHHGGLNRPLFLISPNPPAHTLQGLGGSEYAQWQALSMGQHVAAMAHSAKQIGSSSYMDAYPPRRPLGDLLKELATGNHIRPAWSDLAPLARYMTDKALPEEYFD